MEADANRLDSLFVGYYETAVSVSNALMFNSMPPEALRPAAQKMAEAYDRLAQELNQFREQRYRMFTDTISDADKASASALRLGLASGLAAVLLLIMISTFVSKSITGNMRGVVAAARRLDSAVERRGA